MNFQLPTEQWNLIIGIITLLITSTTMYFFLRDRVEICKIVLKHGTGYVFEKDSGGFPRKHSVPGFEILLRNKGKNSLYIHNVFLCSKHSEEKIPCSFGAIPVRETPNSPVRGFVNRFQFELESRRSVQTSHPAAITINSLKIKDRDKTSLYVRVELESGKVFHSKNLTVQLPELEFEPLEEKK